MNKHQQIILYAKGHYLRSNSAMKDLMTIVGYFDGTSTEENIIRDLAHIALTAIKSAADPVNPLGEYTEQMLFFHRTGMDYFRKHGPSPLDFEGEWETRVTKAYQECVIESMLMIIARWKPDIELEKPNDTLLPLRSPPKKKKEENDDNNLDEI
jgi:hypothetical protein